MSEAVIMPLRPAADPKREPQADVIRMLREVLERAESGEIQAIAIVDVDRDGRGSFLINRPPHVAFTDLIAHTERLKARLMSEWVPS